MRKVWTKENIQDLNGKIVVVTGANSGIGYEICTALAEKNATVVMAVRNMNKGLEAMDKIKTQFPEARIHVLHLDLNDLKSVQQFSQEYRKHFKSLSILINNAGIMNPPYPLTKDGFEAQFGVNYLGHFALTGLLLDLLIHTPESRIITLGSMAAHGSKLQFDDFIGKKKKIEKLKSYRQSKLACLYFAKELQYRLRAKELSTKSIACHPGISQTYLYGKGSSKLSVRATRATFKMIGQSAEFGAYPVLYAATESNLRGGEYIGPDGRKGIKGTPTELSILDNLFDENLSANLWYLAETLTGVKYKL